MGEDKPIEDDQQVIDKESTLADKFEAALSGEELEDDKPEEEEGEEQEVEDPEDPEIEVPGVGKLKASEIRSLSESREKLLNVEQTIQEKMDELKAAESKTEQGRILNDLLGIPEFRQRVQTIIDDMVKPDQPLSKKDGKTIDVTQFKDSRLDEMKSDIDLMREMVRERQIQDHLNRLETMRSGFVEKFGDKVFGKETWDGLLKEQLEQHGDKLDYQHVELAAMRYAMDKGISVMTKKAAQDVASKAAQKGSRVVLAPKSMNQNEKPEPSFKGPMTRAQLASAFEKAL